MNELRTPILVIGATRSGTSMLAEVLGQAADVACWYEPNHLWKIGSAYNGSDYAGPEHARPWVKRWIRRKFLEFQEKAGGQRIVEKSPANVLRIPFVHQVFPEAKIVHIYRDGRANIRSQIEKFEGFASYTVASSHVRGHLANRLASIPWWEWPAYVPRSVAGQLRRYAKKKQGVSWFGLRYSGWKRDRHSLTLSQIAATQWVRAVDTALHDLNCVPAEQWISLRYEDVVADPKMWFGQVAEFCEINIDKAYLDEVSQVVHDKSVSRWVDELDPMALEEAMPIMKPLLVRLGYIYEDDL